MNGYQASAYPNPDLRGTGSVAVEPGVCVCVNTRSAEVWLEGSSRIKTALKAQKKSLYSRVCLRTHDRPVCMATFQWAWPAAGEPYLQAASGTVLRDDVHVGGVDAAADEAGQVLILDVSHLRPQTAHIYRPSNNRCVCARVRGPEGSCDPSSYVLQLKQDLPGQLDPLLVDELHGCQVSLQDTHTHTQPVSR